MRLLLPLVACLGLAGCFDADITMDFSDGETIQTTADLSLSRQLYDMLGSRAASSCKDGKEELTRDSFHCTKTDSRSIAAVLDGGGTFKNTSEFDPSDAARIERIDDNHLRVTFDFSKMLRDDKQMQDLGAMADMLRAAVAGHSMVFTVKGYKVTSTTGTAAADGKSATRVIPVTAILDRAPELKQPFVTELQLAQSCTLWIFCD